MQRFKTLFAVVAVALFVSTQSAQAWNGFGHSCAAYIAEQHLTPEAKAKCEHYLQHSFVFYASWMDQWRYIDPYKATSDWHTIYVENEKWRLEVDRTKSAHYQTERIWNELKDYKNLPDSLVRQNLIYLIHMVPDFHCPVHTFFRSKSVHMARRYTLLNKGKKFSHHTFWDRSPGLKREKWTTERYAKEVDVLSPKQVKKYQKGNVLKWANEAVKEANLVYEITPAGTEITKLSKEQIAEIHKLSDRMILKGACRLAYIINDVFKE
jgi:hypothetical protein